MRTVGSAYDEPGYDEAAYGPQDFGTGTDGHRDDGYGTDGYGTDGYGDDTDPGERRGRRRTDDPARHAYFPGRRMNLGVVLLPLRVFLGFISIYAGMGKLCDPVYFDGGERGSMVKWLNTLHPWDVAEPLRQFALAHPVGAGLVIAFLQVLVGVLTVLGCWQRVAAVIGAGLSAALLVTVSWKSVPVYDAPDIIYLAAWSPLIIAGAPVYSVDGRLASSAWRRLGPRSDIWDLRRYVLRRGALITFLVAGVTLLVGSVLGGAVRDADRVVVPGPGESPRNELPGSPLRRSPAHASRSPPPRRPPPRPPRAPPATRPPRPRTPRPPPERPATAAAPPPAAAHRARPRAPRARPRPGSPPRPARRRAPRRDRRPAVPRPAAAAAVAPPAPPAAATTRRPPESRAAAWWAASWASPTRSRPAPRSQRGAGRASLVRQCAEAAYVTKLAHVPGARASRGPAVCLESRTWTVRGAVAISTQELPSGPSL